MALPEGVARLTFNFAQVSALGSAPAVTFGVYLDDGAFPSMGNAMLVWVQDYWQPNASQTWTILNVTIKSETGEFEQVIGISGDDDDAASSPATSLLVKKGTGHPGRAWRGRSYWPGCLFDSQVDNQGQISSETQALWQTNMQALFDAMNTDDGGMCLISADEIAARQVTTYQVQSTVATQRRRLRG